MRFKLSLFLFSCSFFTLNAQYTDVINATRPGFAESPYSVGSGVYQLETSVFYRDIHIKPTFSIPKSFGVDLLFRTSQFLERLELSAQITYQKDKVAFKNIFVSDYKTNGLSKLTFSGKYLIYEQKYANKSKEIRSWKRRMAYDWNRLIPSVGVSLGINTNLVNSIHKTSSLTPKIGILLQNNLTPYLNIITNFYYDKIGDDYAEFSYIITSTYNLTSNFSYFIENQGVYNQYQSNQNFGTGFAFLFNTNLQINASYRYLMEGEATGNYISLGLSYRLNRHKDKEIRYDKNGIVIKEEKEIKYTKKKTTFFGRFFQKTGNIFKKKKKEKVVQKRKRPKRVRKKSTIKKKKKGFFGKLFGKKKKKKKRNNENNDD